MVISIPHFAVFCIVLASGVLLPISNPRSEYLNFGFYGSLCPSVCDEEIDGQRGFVVDVLDEIGRPDGISIKVEKLPRPRLLVELNSGQVDFLLLPNSAIKKNGLIQTTLPIVQYTIGVMRRRDRPFKFSGIESLKKVNWGVINGTRWRPEYQRHIEQNKGNLVTIISGSKAHERIIKMIISNRIDIFIDNFEMLERLRKLSPNPETLVVDKSFVFGKAVPLYLAFSPNNEEAKKLAQYFTDGIQRLQNSKRLREISLSYGIGEPAQQ